MNLKNSGYYIKRISDFVEADANRELEQFDITFSQARILSYLLARKEKQTIQKDIEDFFELKHPTVIGILQRMEQKGFVVSEIDPKDRRQRIIRTTEQADYLEKEIDSHSKELEKYMVQGMTNEEVLSLKQLLYKVYKNISK